MLFLLKKLLSHSVDSLRFVVNCKLKKLKFPMNYFYCVILVTSTWPVFTWYWILYSQNWVMGRHCFAIATLQF